ncbi:uncharacterized protein [Lolium perenne]|uniref:uncharacterized protein n=1 Tax=Lolium perenne TaxID=4522 RepID=UPI0021EB2A5F|nr:uncharacterized protein LOC127305457 [Lolium perenne]
MASKALLPALVLLALVCGELVIAGNAQTYIGGTSAPSPAGMRPLPYPYARGRAPVRTEPPNYTAVRPSISGDDATGRVPAVEEDKAFMIHSVPAHDRVRPVPVPPTAN